MSRFSHKTYLQNGIEVVELNSENAQLKIAVGIGNTMFSFKRNGNELLHFPFALEEYKTSQKLAGNPFMHPWANRLEGDHITIDGKRHEFPDDIKHLLYRDGNGLPLHGLLLKTDRWQTEILEVTDSFVYHAASLEYDDPDGLRIFPFPHTLDMKTYLHDDEICIEVGLYNSGEQPMPLSFGFHPYFLIDPKSTNELELTIPLRDVLEVNEKMIPTGETQFKENVFPFEKESLILGDHRFDHCFAGREIKRFFHFKQNDRDFELYLDNDYNYLQVYAPNQTDKPYVCLEPMLAPANALNTNSCKMLEPKAFITQEFTISFYDEHLKSDE